jgi:hypothetical protein
MIVDRWAGRCIYVRLYCGGSFDYTMLGTPGRS